MTEQEVENWVARLTRIWSPTRHLVESTTEWQRFEYKGYWSDRTRLTVGCPRPTAQFFFYLQGWKKGRYLYSFVCRTDTTNRVFDSRPLPPEFVAQWLPVFRRNCWLCGCDIAATMHEKLEWIQGFTAEEIGAWNLKL